MTKPSISSFLAKGVFRLQELAKGHRTFRVLGEMQSDQWLSQSDLEHVRSRRFREFMKSATDVPYYARVFRELGLSADDLSTPAILPLLPLLAKESVRENLEQMRNGTFRKVQKFSTGGSTGQPLTFYLGATRVSSDVAARLRAESWFDSFVGDREFAFWGSPIELGRQDRIRSFRDGILRTRLRSAFEMSPATMTQYLDEMERAGCQRVFGYPSSISLLCDHARRQGRDLRKLSLKAVFVTAEYLYEHWRRNIEETFGCPVANGYGGRDSGFVAHECPLGGMHITADRLIVEIIDERGNPQPDGESGEIVVTNLDTPEMPFIRYRTGDIGAISTKLCTCGRSLPLLERVEGRKADFIVTPDGRVMHGLSLIYVMREIPGIKSFRITQRRLTQFDVEIVPDKNYQTESERDIRRAFTSRMRGDVQVRFSYPDSLAASASGKTRHVVSEVTWPGSEAAAEDDVKQHTA